MNKSKNELIIKKIAENNGYKNVKIHWNKMTSAIEKEGCGGGYFMEADNLEFNPAILGHSKNEALYNLINIFNNPNSK